MSNLLLTIIRSFLKFSTHVNQGSLVIREAIGVYDRSTHPDRQHPHPRYIPWGILESTIEVQIVIGSIHIPDTYTKPHVSIRVACLVIREAIGALELEKTPKK